MEGQARSALLVARSARNQQVSPSKILFVAHIFAGSMINWLKQLADWTMIFPTSFQHLSACWSNSIDSPKSAARWDEAVSTFKHFQNHFQITSAAVTMRGCQSRLLIGARGK
jgi:hypothetical protein